jgi:hypothetical protein
MIAVPWMEEDYTADVPKILVPTPFVNLVMYHVGDVRLMKP